VNIQSVSGYTPQLVAAGGSTPGASITDLAQQHGVSRESLVGLVQSKIQQTRQANGQPPLDQTTLDQIIDHALDQDRGQGAGMDESEAEGASAARYTATAQRTADHQRAAGSISILA
jgi:transposase-like protein